MLLSVHVLQIDVFIVTVSSPTLEILGDLHKCDGCREACYNVYIYIELGTFSCPLLKPVIVDLRMVRYPLGNSHPYASLYTLMLARTS